MNQVRPRVEPGQIRQWCFIGNPIDGKSNFFGREGKCFLVVDVDGVRCDTLQEGGVAESFYVPWIINNSVLVSQ